MAEAHQHLTYEKRCLIYALLKSEKSVIKIAAELGCHRSTIHREIRRNSGQKGYRHKQAEHKAQARRRAASVVPRKMTAQMWAKVVEVLRLGWSPEQISGRMKLEGILEVSPKWIYTYIHADRRNGGNLYRHTRRRGKKPNRKGGARAGRGYLRNPVDISQRPAVVEMKKRIGDWEGDTIIGKGHKGALVSMVDRCSKYALLQRVENKTESLVSSAMINMLRATGRPVLTITTDNGKEFAGHEKVSAKLEAGFYFARTYRACDRGLNEHTNGLARQYFPKGTDFRKVPDAAVQFVQDLLNNRPRAILGFRTPEEVFYGRAPPCPP